MHPKQYKWLRLAAVAAGALTLVAAGCSSESESGDTKDLIPVSLMLNGPGAGSSAGFMYAKELGLYEAVGLDVKIDESAGSAIAADALAAGQYDFAFSNAPTVMLTASKGGKIKIVSVIHQNNGFSIISLTETGIRTIADLEGKRVGASPGTATTAMFNAALEQAGLGGKVEEVNIDPSALEAALLQKQVDAILGAAVANSINLRNQGASVSDLLFSDIGVPTIGLALATSEQMIAEKPDIVRKFVAATLKGWDRARQDPHAAAAAVHDQFPAGSDLNVLEAQTDAVVETSLCLPDSPSLGRPSEEILDITFDLLTQFQGLPSSPPIDSYFDWSFHPADAPSC